MPHSPDCWRMETGHYPDSRGYAGIFGGSPIPISGEYLEIPSTTGKGLGYRVIHGGERRLRRTGRRGG